MNEIGHWFNQVTRSIYPVSFPDERQFVIKDVTDMIMAGFVLIIRFWAGFRAVRTFLRIGCHARPIQWRSRFRQLQQGEKKLVNHLENKINDKMATRSSLKFFKFRAWLDTFLPARWMNPRCAWNYFKHVKLPSITSLWRPLENEICASFFVSSTDNESIGRVQFEFEFPKVLSYKFLHI